MATTLKQLGQSAIPSTATTIYTVPASNTAIVKEVILCNTNTSAVTVSLYYVASGGSVGVANTILSEQALQEGETIQISGTTMIGAGGTIKAVASVASVVGITISGVEVS
jgi:hypothetical protein